MNKMEMLFIMSLISAICGIGGLLLTPILYIPAVIFLAGFIGIMIHDAITSKNEEWL